MFEQALKRDTNNFVRGRKISEAGPVRGMQINAGLSIRFGRTFTIYFAAFTFMAPV